MITVVRKPVLKTGLVRTAQSFVITRQKPTTVIRQEKKSVKETIIEKIARYFATAVRPGIIVAKMAKNFV